MAAGIHLYVEDCDVSYKHALEAGATSVSEPQDQFYGDRSAGVNDRLVISGGLLHTKRICQKKK
jgi:uncharacterized glyoxalase superfamily protein PhnB